MIVRNEAHIVQQMLDAVAAHISSWVIVDTGSHDGTQDLIRNHMARLDISGELYERRWRNLGDNRTEALTLAQGHGDYIWILDADDTVVGTPDFTRLGADIYWLRYGDADDVFWRAQLFRDGLDVRYEGVTREYAAWDYPYVDVRLKGEYHIESRRLGVRSPDLQKLALDRDLLLAQAEDDPENARAAFYLAESYFVQGDFVNARECYARRLEMGGWDQEVYVALWRVAESMAQLEVSWPDVQEAYLRAWEFRPTRAEPLYAIADRYRVEGRYQLGYQFAKLAAEIPFPEEDQLFIREDIYAWRATDTKAVCAYWIGKQAEAFALCRRLLARPDLPDGDRQRIATNRDFSVSAMFYAASLYPDVLTRSLVAGPREAEVTVSVVAGPDRQTTEQTLNSFLHCCTDVSRVGRFLVVEVGLSGQDRARLQERYEFLEFADGGPGARPAQLRAQIHGRFWLHLGEGWRFFAHENYIARLTAVLDAETQVFQVGINFGDAAELTGTSADEQAVRRTLKAGRYVLTDVPASGPAMFDTTRLDRVGGLDGTDPDPIDTLGRRAATAGLRTASLDEVLCIAAI